MTRSILKQIRDEHPEYISHIAEELDIDISRVNDIIGALLDNGENPEALNDSDQTIYQSCIEPLLSVTCSGKLRNGHCEGNGWVDFDSLPLSYQEDNFICKACRDANQAESEEANNAVEENIPQDIESAFSDLLKNE